MKHNPLKGSFDPSIRRTNLPYRIGLVVVLSAIITAVGLVLIGSRLYRMNDNYNNLMENEFDNLDHLNTISSSLYQHQSLLLHHLGNKDSEQRALLRKKANDLEDEIDSSLGRLGSNLKGSTDESAYHRIYSGLVGYFSNTRLIFDFSESGDIMTAEYYIEKDLDGYLESVSREIDKLDVSISGQMSAARQSMRRTVKQTVMTAYVMLTALGLTTALTLMYCTRISEQIFNRDLLTGVYNYDRISRIGERLSKKGTLKSYDGIWLSIKDFNFINQQYGSTVGDMVLWSYARRIRSLIARNEYAARNGGDNFILLVNKEHSARIVDKLMEFPVTVTVDGEDKELEIASRCGIYHSQEGDTFSHVVSASSVALGYARSSEGADRVIYTRSINDAMIADKAMVHDFERAINNGEFVVYYQPKVDLRSMKLCGAEALVRWIRGGKIVPPDSFIPLFEREGLVTELDFYVLERVCSDISGWLARGIEPVLISTNFSKIHMRDPGFGEDLLEIIDRSGVDRRYLEAEITESSGHDDPEALKRFVEQMSEAGVRISIDDFGTGYSSLSLVRELKAATVKLDRSFLIAGEGDDGETGRSMIRNIIRMLNDLHHSVICEGVETEAQARFLKAAHCYLAQGYLFDRPLPHDEFEKRLLGEGYGLAVRG